MFCRECGKEIEAGASFCRFCGTRAEGASGMGEPLGGQAGVQGRRGRGTVWKVMFVFVAVLAAAAVAVFLYFSARNRASSIRMAKTTGSIDVQDKEGKELALAEDMMLYKGYQVGTQEESYAWLDLDSVKLAKMDEESRIQIRSAGKQLEVQVDSGNLFFNIKEPLGDEETLDIRTSDMVVGIRGTCGWVEVPDGDHMRVYILEGKVKCSVTDPDSGKVQKENIQAGEMAEMSLSGKDGEWIRTGSFTGADIPDFVREELEEDEGLKAKILDGPEPDLSLEEVPQEDPAAIFERVLSELISAYGIFNANQSGVMVNTSDVWMDPGGVISATFLDFDLDGEEEMLVCHAEPSAEDPVDYVILLSMYEAVEGNAVLASQAPFIAYNDYRASDASLSGNDWSNKELRVNAVRTDSGCYIMCEEFWICGGFADGMAENYWAMVYRDGKLDYAGSFTQVAGGSAGFAYTGYEFENGTLVNSQIYYDEVARQEGGALYMDFGDAIKAFFGKFGIRLIDDLSQYGYNQTSLLSDSSDKTAIFEFINRLEPIQGGYQCNAVLRVDAASAVFGDPSLEAGQPAPGRLPGDPSASEGALPAPSSPDGEYLLPDISSRYLTGEELRRLSKEELRLARNEVYARHGRMFNSEDLQQYFNSKSWYHGEILADRFDESVLNEYEKKNLDLIRDIEGSMQ